MKIVCRVKFRAFGITFGQFERVIPIDGTVWRFVKNYVVRPVLMQVLQSEVPSITKSMHIHLALDTTPPPSDLPTGIKLKLIDERGVYLALE